jgi:hypothetical protein
LDKDKYDVRSHRERNDLDDFSAYEVQQKYIVPEDLPEGPYGSPINKDEPLQPKHVNKEARSYSNFNYENKELHEDMPRQVPGAHPTHDEPNE